jgi:hypothetical protein
VLRRAEELEVLRPVVQRVSDSIMRDGELLHASNALWKDALWKVRHACPAQKPRTANCQLPRARSITPKGLLAVY